MNKTDIFQGIVELIAETPVTSKYTAIGRRVEIALNKLNKTLDQEQKELLKYICSLLTAQEGLTEEKAILYSMKYMLEFYSLISAPRESGDEYDTTSYDIDEIYPVPASLFCQTNNE